MECWIYVLQSFYVLQNMGRKISLIVVSYFIFVLSFAQSKNDEPKKIDTITSYVGLLLESGSNGYFVNKERVSRRMHDYYRSKLDAAIRCKPCWIKNFNIDEKPVSEGLFYGDYPAGKMIEYYSNGKVRCTGFYAPVDYTNLNRWYSENAGKKDSTWSFFNIYGNLIKVEYYKNGLLSN